MYIYIYVCFLLGGAWLSCLCVMSACLFVAVFFVVFFFACLMIVAYARLLCVWFRCLVGGGVCVLCVCGCLVDLFCLCCLFVRFVSFLLLFFFVVLNGASFVRLFSCMFVLLVIPYFVLL